MQFKVDRPQTTVVAKNLSVLQLFISRMPKMCAILQLVSAPLNPIKYIQSEKLLNLLQCLLAFQLTMHLLVKINKN